MNIDDDVDDDVNGIQYVVGTRQQSRLRPCDGSH